MATELVTTTDLGALNARRLADAIVASGAISRAQLARDTGLSKPTVSIALARLESAGLVREVGRTQGGRGATALLYDLVPHVGSSLALDVGRRWIRARVCDLAGRDRATLVEATRGTTAGLLGEQLVTLAQRTMHAGRGRRRRSGGGHPGRARCRRARRRSGAPGAAHARPAECPGPGAAARRPRGRGERRERRQPGRSRRSWSSAAAASTAISSTSRSAPASAWPWS